MYNYAAAAAKRRKKETSPSSSFDSLPDAVAISCLARVSRLDQAALSVVSKRFRSLVVSPEFYKTRSLMDPATGKTVKRAQPIPFFRSQPREGSAVVSLDGSIYVFGGLVNGERTSGVLLLDCRYHTWHQVTPMRVARASATAQVVNGKIYVLGGCKDRRSADWGEVFDPKTQTWAALTVSEPMPDEEDPDTRPRMSLIHGSVVIEDKIYVIDFWNRTFFYSLSHVGNDGCIHWCEPHELDRCAGVGMNWTELSSYPMKELQNKLIRSRVVHFGGKMARVWEKTTRNFTKCLEDILPGAKLASSGHNVVCSNAILNLDPILDRSKVLYSISVDV
ncbi:BnaC05g49580D [Brassica napus]|uniref:BnaC05g49580D protein n=1 Tax=Brassica napus TaxID=3708 RepID=A0A078IL51_BRANA|nr:BnaC05g49580D [Brassica napus]